MAVRFSLKSLMGDMLLLGSNTVLKYVKYRNTVYFHLPAKFLISGSRIRSHVRQMQTCVKGYRNN